MVLLKVFFPLATLSTVALASPFAFYLYPLLSYSDIYQERAYEICPENGTHVEIYREILKDAHKCFEDFSQSSHSICHSLEINVQRCSQPLVDYFVDCLPEKSKDLPPALVKAAASLIETFCTSSGELLLEALNECLYEFPNQRNKTIREGCKEGTLQPKLDKFCKEVPSKSEACQVASEIGDCWEEYVVQDCKSSKTKELFSKFYNAVLSPCKNNEIF